MSEKKQLICSKCGETKNVAHGYNFIKDIIEARCLNCFPFSKEENKPMTEFKNFKLDTNKGPKILVGPYETDLPIRYFEI